MSDAPPKSRGRWLGWVAAAFAFAAIALGAPLLRERPLPLPDGFWTGPVCEDCSGYCASVLRAAAVGPPLGAYRFAPAGGGGGVLSYEPLRARRWLAGVGLLEHNWSAEYAPTGWEEVADGATWHEYTRAEPTAD